MCIANLLHRLVLPLDLWLWHDADFLSLSAHPAPIRPKLISLIPIIGPYPAQANIIDPALICLNPNPDPILTLTVKHEDFF